MASTVLRVMFHQTISGDRTITKQGRIAPSGHQVYHGQAHVGRRVCGNVGGETSGFTHKIKNKQSPSISYWRQDKMALFPHHHICATYIIGEGQSMPGLVTKFRGRSLAQAYATAVFTLYVISKQGVCVCNVKPVFVACTYKRTQYYKQD